MKIAIVARHVVPTVGSQGDGPHCADQYCDDETAHVSGLGRALAGAGHRVVIYARRDREELASSVALGRGLTVQYLPAGPAAPVPAEQLPSYLGAFAAQLAARWGKSAPDVVHAHHWTSGLAALAAARERQVPVLQTFGSLAAAERQHGIVRPDQEARARMEACIARAAAGVLAGTEAEAADLARLGIAGYRVSVVPGGIDTAHFSPEGPAAKTSEQVRLLHVGSLADDERVDVLIRALAGIPDAELVLAGGPAPEDLDADAACKRLGKLAAALGVADRVTFTGRVGHAELPALMRSADMFISAARYEPFGRTAVSAMACGTPVVAMSTGAFADAVIDGTTGVLLSPGRPEALAARVRSLLSTPMQVAAFGIAAADRAKSRYAWKRIGAETAAVYERCLDRAATGPAVGSGARLPAGYIAPAAARRRAA